MAMIRAITPNFVALITIYLFVKLINNSVYKTQTKTRVVGILGVCF